MSRATTSAPTTQDPGLGTKSVIEPHYVLVLTHTGSVFQVDLAAAAPFHMGREADLAWTVVFGTMIAFAIMGNLAVLWIVLGEISLRMARILMLFTDVCVSLSQLTEECRT